MRGLAARTMPFVVAFRGARTVGPAMLAGLLALGAMLAIAAQALTPPDVDTGENGEAPATSRAASGGETIVAKFPEAEPETEAVAPSAPAEPAPEPRRVAMALAAKPSAAPPRDEKPNLDGLNEIPREFIWNRPPDKEDKAEPKAFAAFSNAREVLPWDAVEPVPFAPLSPAPAPPEGEGAKATAALPQPLDLPDGAEVGAWVKAKVTEVKGADRSRPLYHFELWLEPPAEVKGRLVGVAYDFSTPAIRPQLQASNDRASGFRVSAGGLACADKITVTLRFDDGRSHKVVVDGCKLLG